VSPLSWWRKRQRRRALASIRESLAFFGVLTDRLTDEEIERWIEDEGAMLSRRNYARQVAASP